MSRYLVDRVEAAENIEVRFRTEVVRGGGTDHLEWLTLVDLATREEETVAANWLYAFIGALPRTDWLGDHVARDERGFVLTGPDVAALDGDGDGRALAAGAPPAAARDERARSVRRRRRAAQLDEAGRLGRRRGVELGQQRPPLPGDGMSLIDDLRSASLTHELSEEQLSDFASHGEGP